VAGFRCGFVGVVGRPNVGKSTLVNALVGQKVAIVSDVPQTTRRRIRGVLSTDAYQVVFTDTPGFHKPRTALGRRLNEVVGQSLQDVDVALMVVDAAAGVGRGDAFVYTRRVAPLPCPKVCAVNKVDGLRHERIVPQLAAAGALGAWDEIVPVSAATGRGLGELLEILVARLPEGSPAFPRDQVTDQSVEERTADLIREKAIRLTREEVPHSIAVVVEELSREDDLTRIAATLLVERESQKGIVIGRHGAMLKEIGTRARREIEPLLGTRVFLELRVKVQHEWQRDPSALTRLGF